eukprot:TRINITY_DN4825_c0_g1_i1.p1 TRINITY_DN4825_c0_g1~~TRINITY_DN4825_c0_g1_i1.p1  ORF type:complete len:830 (+),score=134.51 TRINITY_DN4825_c0_g1_i1:158-2647(+)
MEDDNPIMNTVKHVCFQVSGFKGLKNAIFIPDNVDIDQRLMDHIMKSVDLKRPNLLIQGEGGAFHPQNMFTTDELDADDIRALLGTCESQDEENDREDHTRDVIVNKLKMLSLAFLHSVENIGAATFHYSTWLTSFDQICHNIREIGASHWTSIACMHVNDEVICKSEAKKMIKQLFEKATTLSADSVTNKICIELDGSWIAGGIEIDLAPSTAYSGHACLTDGPDPKLKPEDQRHPASQFCFLGANVLLLFYSPAEEDSNNIDYTKIVPTPCHPLPRRSLIAPTCNMFFGGRSLAVLNTYADAFENMVPSVMVKHSGGLTNVYAELVESINKIIQGQREVIQENCGEEKFKHYEANIVSYDSQKVLREIVEPSLLLTNACRRAKQSESEGVRVTLAKAVKLVDLAATNQRRFTLTFKVIDPLKTTHPECLDILGQFTSSDIIGMTDTSSSENVIKQAWCIHYALKKKAKHLLLMARMVSISAALATWLTLVLVWIMSLDDLEAAGYGPALVRTLVVLVPLLGTFFYTLGEVLQLELKWSIAEMASAEIKSHIYNYRASAGLYATHGEHRARNEESGEEPCQIFSRVIGNICRATLHSVLRNDFVTDGLIPGENCDSMAQMNLYALSKGILFAGTVEFRDSSEAKQEYHDDGITPLTAQKYYRVRFERTRDTFLRDAITMRNLYIGGSVISPCCGCVASILAAFDYMHSIPVVVGFMLMLQYHMSSMRWAQRLKTMNDALGGLLGIEVMKKKASTIEMRRPAFKEELVTLTEKHVLTVMMAETGGRLLFGSETQLPSSAQCLRTIGLQDDVLGSKDVPVESRAAAPQAS